MSDIIQTPPVWEGIDTKKANKWIDENIRPLAKNVDDFFMTIVGFEQFLQEILDFAITFLQGIKNPLIALIQAIIDALRVILNDLSQAGFYFTYDSALKDISSFKEIGKFEGGYSRFKQQLTEKLTNPKDLGRPNFSELTGVLTLTAYASADVEDWMRAYTSVIQFSNLFKIDIVASYPPPVNISTGYYKTRNGLKLELVAKDMDISQPPEGLLVKWSLPSAKKTRLFPDIKAPPDYFLITVSTRSAPLILVKERQVTSSTSGTSTLNTKVEPIYLNSKKTEVATTLLLSEVYQDGIHKENRLKHIMQHAVLDPNAELSDGQFKIYATDYINSPMKISLEKLIPETYSFVIDTGVFGVLFTGADYKEELSYRQLPRKLYDHVSDIYSEEISSYYVSISSIIVGRGKLNTILKPDNLSSQIISENQPKSSIPIEHKAIVQSTLQYLSATREALTRFLVYEPTLLTTTKKVISKQYETDILALRRVYSLFGISDMDANYLLPTTSSSFVYHEQIKKFVDRAMGRILNRGLPNTKEIERIKDSLDYFNEGRLKNKNLTGYYFYKSLISWKDNGNDGIYRDARLGDEDYTKVEDRKKESWFRKDPSLSFELEDDKAFNYRDKAGDRTPLFKKGENIIYPVLEEDFEYFRDVILSLPSKKREIAVGESEWKFERFFGKFPELEELLESIESFLLSISKSLASFIDALIEYINLIKQRIASIMAFISRIKDIIDMLLNLRLPDTNIKYLVTRSRGTLGFVEDLSLAKKQPSSGIGVYSTYVCLVFGSGLPKIAEDFILGFLTPLIENENSQDEVQQL